MPDDNRTQEIEKRIDPVVAGAIALSGVTANVFSIAPQNVAELMEFAKLMSVSGPCVRPAFRNKPGACMAIAMQAFRTGADPFAVANKAYITTNRAGEEQIAYEAQYINSVLNTSKQLAKRLRATYKGQGDSRQCTIIGYIAGEEEPFEYESPTVGAIAVKNSPMWKGDPDQQLYYYSSRAWARRYLPEVILGMYTPDEVHGEVIDVTPPPPPRREEFREAAPDAAQEPEQRQTETALLAEAAALDETREVSEPGEVLPGAELDQAYANAMADWQDKSKPMRVHNRTGATLPSTTAVISAPFLSPTEDAFGLPLDEAGEKLRLSLLVPPRQGPRQGTTDWIGTADDMIARVAKIANPADAAPRGRFELANKETLDGLSRNAKQQWAKVKYALSQREKKLREQAVP